MGAFSPPWPPTLLEPIEYEAFWRVPGPQKAESHQIPPILVKMAKGSQNGPRRRTSLETL